MNRIFILGDIHGSYYPIDQLIDNLYDVSLNDTLILLGDAGFNFFFNKRDTKIKKKVNNCGLTIFTIRGNHEERPSNCIKKDPNDWHTEIFWENKVYVENDFPNIKYALDYPAKYNISLNSKLSLSTLVLPGAYSVDKYYRLTNHWTWFPDEQCTKEEMLIADKLASDYNTFDLVLSHSSPAIYEPTDLYLAAIDQSTVDKTTERWLGNIESKINYRLWCFGHFHKSRVYPEYNNKQMLMLYNDYVLNASKYFQNNTNIYDCLIDIK